MGRIRTIAFGCKLNRNDALVSVSEFFKTLATEGRQEGNAAQVHSAETEVHLPARGNQPGCTLAAVAGFVFSDDEYTGRAALSQEGGTAKIETYRLPPGKTFIAHNYFVAIPHLAVGLYLHARGSHSRVCFEAILKSVHQKLSRDRLAVLQTQDDWDQKPRKERDLLAQRARAKLKIAALTQPTELVDLLDSFTDIETLCMEASTIPDPGLGLVGLSDLSYKQVIQFKFAVDKNTKRRPVEAVQSLLRRVLGQPNPPQLWITGSLHNDPSRIWHKINHLGTINVSVSDDILAIPSLVVTDGNDPAILTLPGIKHLLELFSEEIVRARLKI